MNIMIPQYCTVYGISFIVLVVYSRPGRYFLLVEKPKGTSCDLIFVCVKASPLKNTLKGIAFYPRRRSSKYSN